MISAQDFVTVLRKGCCFKALEFINFVVQKYTQFKSPIGAEELLPLGCYEICLTDFNENDTLWINFLYNYVLYHDCFTGGEFDYKLMMLVSWVNVALAIKYDPQYKNIIEGVTITNTAQLNDFIKASSDFSQLVDRNMKMQKLSSLLKPLNLEELVKKIAEMKTPIYCNFLNDLEEVKIQLTIEGIRFTCPILQEAKPMRTIKQILFLYKTHLREKLLEDNFIIVEENLGLLYLGVPTAKQVKLIHRYECIAVLEQQLQNKCSLGQEDKLAIVAAIDHCRKNEPEWGERRFFQQFTDILSVGIKPLYRNFFSKEAFYLAGMQEVAEIKGGEINRVCPL